MTEVPRAGLRALSFGVPDGSLWAAAIGGSSPGLVIGDTAGDGTGVAHGLAQGLSFDGSDTDTWTITGDGVALTVTPTPPPTPPPAQPSSTEVAITRLELCRVAGTVTLGDGERSVDAVGTRLAVDRSAKGKMATARMVAGWLTESDALTLIALRPKPDARPDGDVVDAALFDADGWLPVTEPRLSTTYDQAGAPTRTNLELWVGEGEDEYPRRVAGEVRGPAGTVTTSGLSLTVAPLICHSRGMNGAGVYALATF